MHQWLQQTPLWLFIIIPTAVLALITFFLSKKNTRLTFWVGFATLAVMSAGASLHLLEAYFTNHFIGSYNRYGLPTHFSKPGWWLFLVGWPIWVLPTVFFVVVTNALSWIYLTVIRTKRQLDKGKNSQDIVRQMELQKLKTTIKMQSEALKKANQVISDMLDKQLGIDKHE